MGFKKIIFFIPLFTFFSLPLFAGNDNPSLGARAAGMGNAAVTLSDVWSANHNQAGLAFLKKPVAGTYYENRFFLKEIGVKGLAFALPVKDGVFGMSFNYSGGSWYNESKFGLAYAKTFGEKLSIGMQMNYMGIRIAEGYGSKSALTAEVGILAKLTNELTIGAHIFNPTHAKLAEYNNEKIATIMRLGLDYKFNKKVILALETLKNSSEKPTLKVGLEYQIMEKIFLRTGIATKPSLNTFGIGVKLNSLILDFASSVHPVLGFSPKMSMAYSF